MKKIEKISSHKITTISFLLNASHYFHLIQFFLLFFFLYFQLIPDPLRPLYQYSLDRKKTRHTYTCEQNAQILLRLEKEHQKKYGSAGRLVSNFIVFSSTFLVFVCAKVNLYKFSHSQYTLLM